MKYLVVAACVLFAAPVAAQEAAPAPAPYDAGTKSLEELIAKTSDDADPWLERPCDLGVPLFGELVEREPEQKFFRRGQLFAGALCDDIQKDYASGFAKVKALEAGWPDLDFNGLGFYFAFRVRDAQDYLARLRGLDQPAIEALDPVRFWEGFRMIREEGAEDQFNDLMLAWVDEKRLAYIPIEMQGGVASSALDAAMRQGRTAMAPQLLANIRSPSSYLGFIPDRKYEAIWPLVEERAGPNLETIADEYVFWAMARLENHPRDRDRFSEAARALHYAGRFEEAIALARQWRERDGAMALIEQGDAWAFNIEAYAHDALGQVDEADTIFDQLARLDSDEHPWVVNMVINRASRLVGQERWEEGLAAATLARGVAEKWGNDFARMIIARDHACALQALGRTDEIGKELAFLRENRTKSHFFAAQALLCVGERQEAADLLLEGVQDAQYRDAALGALTSRKFDLFYTPSKLPEPVALLDERADLKAAYYQYAREIPEKYIPAASLRAQR
jgi:tetratricopeptide (TPR) repeat protein